uniref:Uncharacterized protein n=1 Tax=Cacopsylla melanoneura TaxID=428564 RepID=A0A8D9A941_9HEMI
MLCSSLFNICMNFVLAPNQTRCFCTIFVNRFSLLCDTSSTVLFNIHYGPKDTIPCLIHNIIFIATSDFHRIAKILSHTKPNSYPNLKPKLPQPLKDYIPWNKSTLICFFIICNLTN